MTPTNSTAALSSSDLRRRAGRDGADAPRAARAAEAAGAPAAAADACILLWMAGGMAAPETFDPKALLPFEIGLPVEKVISTFPAIDTVVDNIKITAGLENIAEVMDRGTLIRSHVQPDLGHILHSRHQYHWHTGYVPPQTVAAPHIGAWMARVLGPRNPVMPAFINIGQRLEGNGEKGRTQGLPHRRLFRQRVRPVQSAVSRRRRRAPCARPKGMTPERFEIRYKHYRELVNRSPQRRARQRPPAGVDAARDGKRPSPAQLAGTRRVRSLRWSRRRATTNTTRAASAAAACSPGGWWKPARGSSK